jgi:drug/metabolite transporter (DMT)-like permease
MSKTLQAHLALLAANIIYGVNYSIAKIAMPAYIKPFGFILLRVSGALILFVLVSALFVREKVERKDIPHLALLGLFGVALNQMLFFKGLSMTTPSNAAIIMVSNPIITIIFASIFLREKLASYKLAGVLAGAAGVIVLLSDHKFSFGSDTFLGDLFVLINSASWAVYLILVKPLMMKYNTITIVKWVFFFGLLYVLPFGFNELREVEWHSLPGRIWLALGFVVIATTFIAYILNTYALRALSPAVVSAYIYLQPFLAALFAIYVVPMFDPGAQMDSITWLKIGSAVLIFTGVYLVSRPSQSVNNR